MKSLTFAQIEQINQAMKDAIRAIAQKHDLAIEMVEKVGASNLGVSFNAKFAVKDSLGMAMSHERRMFETLASRYGFSPTDYGKTFYFRGTGYQISGLNPSAPRFAVEVKRLKDGKMYRMTPRDVIAGLPVPAKAA
jgi:hypothetical protein